MTSYLWSYWSEVADLLAHLSSSLRSSDVEVHESTCRYAIQDPSNRLGNVTRIIIYIFHIRQTLLLMDNLTISMQMS